jgi:hypothetical protein
LEEQAVALADIVGVCPRNQVSASQVHHDIACRSKATVGLMMIDNPIPIWCEHRARTVSRAVVNNDNLSVPKRLVQ